MIDVFVYDGIRTPFGRHAGALAAVRPDDLLAGTLATLMARSPFRGEDVEDVIAGCTNQAGEDWPSTGCAPAVWPRWWMRPGRSRADRGTCSSPGGWRA